MKLRSGVFVVFAGGALATFLTGVLPTVPFAYRAPAAHVALETAAGVVAFIAALLVFGRFRQRGRLDDLMLVAALGSLSVSNLVFSAIPSATAGSGGAFTTWAPMIGRSIGALLFAIAALVRSVPVRRPTTSAAVVVGTLIVVLASVGASVAAAGMSLPAGIDPEHSRQLASFVYLVTHPVVSGAQYLTMSLYVVAAVGFTARAQSGHDEFHSWLALGASFAAISKLNYALFPSLYTDWVYTGDIFRLCFYVVLLIGATRVIATHWRDFAQIAVLEERTRLARDLHDGLAQELAYITRRARRMTRGADDGDVAQIAAAAQRALVDSRLAIAALTRPIDDPLEVAIAQSVEDTAARVGANVDVNLEPGIQASPETREALVRIATEAVWNAARHASGGRIEVELTENPRVRLVVRDNGPGFDPDAVVQTTGSGFGLISMQDRAKALGADFRITSRRGEGTEVEVVLP